MRTVNLLSPVTQFSGYGYANICTYLPEAVFGATYAKITELEPDNGSTWATSEFDLRAGYLGYDRSLRRLEGKESAGNVCLGWRPGAVASAIKSIAKLTKISSCFFDNPYEVTLETDLPCLGISVRNECDINADLEDGIWDEIERESFSSELLPAINADYRVWLEDNDNYPCLGCRPITVSGNEGNIQFQVYQPLGNGLWISGSRTTPSRFDHQLSDHNTDTYYEAMYHVVGLCFVLKHCRQAILERCNVK